MNVYTDKLNMPGVSEMHLDCVLQLPLQDPNFSCQPVLHKTDVRIQNILISVYEISFSEEQKEYVWIRSLQKQLRRRHWIFHRVTPLDRYCTDFRYLHSLSPSCRRSIWYLIRSCNAMLSHLMGWGRYMDVISFMAARASQPVSLQPRVAPRNSGRPTITCSLRTNGIRET